jgi:uncharacterized protein YndB with AHSA1/START domain
MDKKLVAKASTTIQAPAAKVWEALVTPSIIKKYMFGTNVVSDFKKGSPITWKGEWEGKKYEDKGVILDLQPNRKLAYSHYSPLSGQPEKPENFHTVTIDLTDKGKQTLVALSQDNNANEKERDHSQKNWEMMLSGLKKVLES